MDDQTNPQPNQIKYTFSSVQEVGKPVLLVRDVVTRKIQELDCTKDLTIQLSVHREMMSAWNRFRARYSVFDPTPTKYKILKNAICLIKGDVDGKNARWCVYEEHVDFFWDAMITLHPTFTREAQRLLDKNHPLNLKRIVVPRKPPVQRIPTIEPALCISCPSCRAPFFLKMELLPSIPEDGPPTSFVTQDHPENNSSSTQSSFTLRLPEDISEDESDLSEEGGSYLSSNEDEQ